MYIINRDNLCINKFDIILICISVAIKVSVTVRYKFVYCRFMSLLQKIY